MPGVRLSCEASPSAYAVATLLRYGARAQRAAAKAQAPQCCRSTKNQARRARNVPSRPGG
eukprot:14493457-Alexandrium_andersonii.AAC.1